MTAGFQPILTNSIHESLADLLDYPGLNCGSLIELCAQLVAERHEISEPFFEFREETKALSLSSLQELYTRTFDLNPVCSLDIGYHLFGENYKRGIFLANLRETETPFDLGQEQQLPDYLPVLLRLLPKLEDEELRSALIVDCINPALEKMLEKLSEGENPYRHLIELVRLVLHSEPSVALQDSQVRRVRARASLPVLEPAEQVSA